MHHIVAYLELLNLLQRQCHLTTAGLVALQVVLVEAVKNLVVGEEARLQVVVHEALVQRAVDGGEKGKVIRSYQPDSVGRVMSEEEAEFLNELMRAVVTDGTAKVLNNDSYTVAGKTGTAEFAEDINESHAWFTAFAPADDPEICVTIIIEKAGTGVEYAVPLAKRIFNAYFGVN